MKYDEFLASKAVAAKRHGFDASEVDTGRLFPFQAHILRWSLERGRSAIFADCGLGKTPIQLLWAREVCRHTDGRVIIVAPLAVAQQTLREARKFGVEASYARREDEAAGRIIVTNYERLSGFDTASYAGVVLDESSILKSFMGKTKQALIEAFLATPFRLCCTATPAPNDYMELGNHCQFLGVMDSSEMISRWFINDTSQFGSYRLKNHAVVPYWDWVTSWAMCVGKPSDIGDFDDCDFVLPEMAVHKHMVEVNIVRGRGENLFRIPDLSATSVHKERRMTSGERSELIAKLVAAEPSEQWLIWCDTNYEADALLKAIDGAVDVRGAEPLERKEQKLVDFTEGRLRCLVTKPKIAGFGLNWQQCARVAFVGPTFSYEQYYQAIRRTWRFGQERPVDVHIAMAHTERDIWDIQLRKTEEHETMKREMFAAARRATQRAAAKDRLATTELELPAWLGSPVVHAANFTSTDEWCAVHGDCVDVVADLEDGSLDLAVYSPPFSNLYIYSNSDRDMGNCYDDGEFLEHYRFLVELLFRKLRPGRLAVVHCKDLVNYKGRDGMAGLRDLPGDLIRVHQEAGFSYHSRCTIWKCPVTEMRRTKAHGLLYKQLRTDSTFSRQGLAEYVLCFRKWAGDTESSDVEPVAHTFDSFPLPQWQKWASPVWDDIDQTRVLNSTLAREDSDEKHICPLQLDVIDRAVELWSNPGDVVLSPFMGVGSEGVGALQAGRKFIGVELKKSYYDQAVRFLSEAKQQLQMFG